MPLTTPRRRAGLGIIVVILMALAGCAGGESGSGPTPTPEQLLPIPTTVPPVFPPQGVADFAGYTGGPREDPPPTSTPYSKGFWMDSASILVRFDAGSMSFDTGRCLIEGQASYKMSQDGTWSFDAGTVAQGQCGGDEAGADFRVLIDTLQNSTHWSFVNNHPSMLGSYYVIADDTTAVYLQVPSADSTGGDGYQDPSSSFGTLAPKPLPDVTQDPAGLVGTWDVLTQSVPYDWKVEISSDRIVLPRGCNTGTGDGYLATADGRWFYGSDTVRTLVGCISGQLAESESTHDALFDAANWRIGTICAALGGDSPDRVQVNFTDATGRTTLVLTRPMRTGETGLPQLTCGN